MSLFIFVLIFWISFWFYIFAFNVAFFIIRLICLFVHLLFWNMYNSYYFLFISVLAILAYQMNLMRIVK